MLTKLRLNAIEFRLTVNLIRLIAHRNDNRPGFKIFTLFVEWSSLLSLPEFDFLCRGDLTWLLSNLDFIFRGDFILIHS